jgi:hypothetical protein
MVPEGTGLNRGLVEPEQFHRRLLECESLGRTGKEIKTVWGRENPFSSLSRTCIFVLCPSETMEDGLQA